MSAPPILGPVDDPSAEEYTPEDLGEAELGIAVMAAKEMLSWMRNKGIRCQVLQVGQVRLMGVEDDYPRKRPHSAPKLRDMDMFEDGPPF